MDKKKRLYKVQLNREIVLHGETIPATVNWSTDAPALATVIAVYRADYLDLKNKRHGVLTGLYVNYDVNIGPRKYINGNQVMQANGQIVNIARVYP